MTEQPPPPLAPVDEGWSRALCVVAHPDDMEFGGAAAVARWTGQGKQVVYCMVTSGEAGIDGMHPDECRTVREAEQVESARVVGVSEVEFLGLPDGVLEYGVPLRRAIAEVVRRHRPEVVITNNFQASWGGAGLNQADHVATGRATIDAVRDAANRWIFHEQLEAGLDPWDGVRAVWAAGSPLATQGVDITATFDAGVDSLRAHKAYIEGLGWEDFDPAEFLEGASRATGSRMGVAHAVGFEVFSLRWGD
jgi:LmbE family N-acetylglucosaminyl deacetylase